MPGETPRKRRNVKPNFRRNLCSGSKDYIIVGSDSGRVVILEYNPTKNVFDKVHQETFGKSGSRRIVPGHYLAVDPKGRAVMLAAIEKQKLVYVLNRDSAAKLTISSPLEAHKNHTILYSVCGVDVGFENPIFACIEVDYEAEDEQKSLTFYELDLGLNHVVRKWSDTIDAKSNLLITVPGGADGPGGVLVCTENFLIYKNQGQAEIKASIPRRKNVSSEQNLLIVSYATHRQKDMFFFLVQSEHGDLYRVTLSYEVDAVNEIKIRYFDTVPVSSSMCVLKNGLLFVASEFGNHMLYQFKSMGDDEEAMEISESDDAWVYFNLHKLRNLNLIDTVESLSPIIDFKVADLAQEDTPQIYALCGRGIRSSIRVLRHGLAVNEMAVSGLPGNPSAVWTVKGSLRDRHHKYIIVSFINATLVLAIGETVEEATDSGVLLTAPTLHAANIGDDSIIQVHPNGIRHIRSDQRMIEWKTPGKKTIIHATSNERQVVIALSGGEIIYFELDQLGNLSEVEKKALGNEIACPDVAPIQEGLQRSNFLAVGDWDNTVRIFSLDPSNILQPLSVQSLPTHPESLSIITLGGSMFLNIGLNNGLLLRASLDPMNGELSDTRTRFLGARPVKLFKIKLRGESATLALSSRAWLSYYYQTKHLMTPLSYTTLDYSASFASEQCPEGIVSVSGNTLRIISVEKLGEMFNQSEIPLLHTPRKFLIHPITNHLITIETDHNACSTKEKEQYQVTKEIEDANVGSEQPISLEEERIFGEPKPGFNRWASCIRVLDIPDNKTSDLVELTDNEAAVSMCTCVFKEREGEVLLVVGTAKDMTLHPLACSSGFIHVYRLSEGRLEFLHKTPTEYIPSALCPFQGRLLVGSGRTLRIYDMGKKKLLRKCENKNFPTYITAIQTQGDRIYVSDVQESVHFCKYKRNENQLYIFADEPVPRWLTSSTVLDYDTVAGSDKFGNVFVSRLPSQVSDEIEEDPTGSKLKVDQGYLNGAPHKLEDLIEFYVGDTVSSIQKASLVPGGSDALVYTTILGTIGALIPFTNREDVDFFSHLEMHLRQENPPLCGRDHLSFRSYYFPVKNVIDGDLCEQFSSIDPEKQRQIANELDRSPKEVMKKLEDIRNRLL